MIPKRLVIKLWPLDKEASIKMYYLDGILHHHCQMQAAMWKMVVDVGVLCGQGQRACLRRKLHCHVSPCSVSAL